MTTSKKLLTTLFLLLVFVVPIQKAEANDPLKQEIIISPSIIELEGSQGRKAMAYFEYSNDTFSSFEINIEPKPFLPNNEPNSPPLFFDEEKNPITSSIASWLTIEDFDKEIIPGEKKKVRFAFEIPQNATPQKYYLAFSVASKNTEKASISNNITPKMNVLTVLDVKESPKGFMEKIRDDYTIYVFSFLLLLVIALILIMLKKEKRNKTLITVLIVIGVVLFAGVISMFAQTEKTIGIHLSVGQDSTPSTPDGPSEPGEPSKEPEEPSDEEDIDKGEGDIVEEIEETVDQVIVPETTAPEIIPDIPKDTGEEIEGEPEEIEEEVTVPVSKKPSINILALVLSLIALSLLGGIAYLLFAIFNKKIKGVVYDSESKEPIENARVSLLGGDDKTELQTFATNKKGIFKLEIPQKGKEETNDFYISAEKNGYKFPSTKLKGKRKDGSYTNLYFGEKLKDKKIKEKINIPLDPKKNKKKKNGKQ